MSVSDIIVGDSKVPEQAQNWDMFVIGILEDVSAGATSILIPITFGLYPLSEYTLVSTSNAEMIQIESVELVDGNIQVNLMSALSNSYPVQTLMARSTLGVSNASSAVAKQLKQTQTWFVNQTWAGTSGSSVNPVPLNLSYGQQSQYTIQDNAVVQAGGLVSLE
jgi:hypothetical protein